MTHTRAIVWSVGVCYSIRSTVVSTLAKSKHAVKFYENSWPLATRQNSYLEN